MRPLLRVSLQDVVVGAFQSDAALVLRSRPVVNVMTTLRVYPKVIDPGVTQCRRDGLPYNCFKLHACLRFTVNPPHRFTSTTACFVSRQPKAIAAYVFAQYFSIFFFFSISW